MPTTLIQPFYSFLAAESMPSTSTTTKTKTSQKTRSSSFTAPKKTKKKAGATLTTSRPRSASLTKKKKKQSTSEDVVATSTEEEKIDWDNLPTRGGRSAKKATPKTFAMTRQLAEAEQKHLEHEVVADILAIYDQTRDALVIHRQAIFDLMSKISFNCAFISTLYKKCHSLSNNRPSCIQMKQLYSHQISIHSQALPVFLPKVADMSKALKADFEKSRSFGAELKARKLTHVSDAANDNILVPRMNDLILTNGTLVSMLAATKNQVKDMQKLSQQRILELRDGIGAGPPGSCKKFSSPLV